MAEHVAWRYQCEVERMLMADAEKKTYPVYTASGRFVHICTCTDEDHARLIAAAPEVAAKLAALEARRDSLFKAIAHGVPEHEGWLYNAIKAHFDGRTVERPRAAKNDPT